MAIIMWWNVSNPCFLCLASQCSLRVFPNAFCVLYKGDWIKGSPLCPNHVSKVQIIGDMVSALCGGVFLDSMNGREQDARDLLEDKGTTRDAASGRDNLQSRLSELERLPILLVRCSFNNTYVNIQDHTGRLLTWISAVSACAIVVRGIKL